MGLAKRLGLKAEPAQIVKTYEEYLEKIEAKEKTAARFQSKVKTVEAPPEFDQDYDDDQGYSQQINALEISELESLSKVVAPPRIILSKTEKLLVQELVQLPSLFSEEKTLELLDFVISDEVKKYIGKVKKVVLEIDEAEYSSVISNLTSSPEYSPELREAVSSALFKYKVRELDLKTKNKIFADLKTKLQMEQLKNKKDEIKKLQLVCQSDEEMNKLLQNLSELEVNLQALKKAKIK